MQVLTECLGRPSECHHAAPDDTLIRAVCGCAGDGESVGNRFGLVGLFAVAAALALEQNAGHPRQAPSWNVSVLVIAAVLFCCYVV